MRRRNFLAAGGATVGTLLAGCTGSQPNSTGSETTSTTTTTTTTSSYSVEMAPVDEVTFESVPKTWVSYFSTYGDMAIALGQADGLQGMVFTENYPTQFYEELGLDVDVSGATQIHSDGVAKEAFYALDADVHLMDPTTLTNWFEWDESDVAEVASNVGPFVGNMIRRRDDWHDYRYYTTGEAFEKVAQVFQERDRYTALESVRDSLRSDVESRLPAESERPEIGLLSVNSDFETGSFWAYPIGEAAGKQQYRDLGVGDAFAQFEGKGAIKLDYEGLLEIDPDAFVFHFGVSHATQSEFEAKMDEMRDDPVGSKLSAVQNDRLYRGGTPYQGPIVNLFQTELAARQFYPDTFTGELFERSRVADIVTREE